MLAPDEKDILHAFIAGRVADRDQAVLSEEVEAVNRSFPAFGALEGMDISVALRAAGFNRDYNDRRRSPIVYLRRG